MGIFWQDSKGKASARETILSGLPLSARVPIWRGTAVARRH